MWHLTDTLLLEDLHWDYKRLKDNVWFHRRLNIGHSSLQWLSKDWGSAAPPTWILLQFAAGLPRATQWTGFYESSQCTTCKKLVCLLAKTGVCASILTSTKTSLPHVLIRSVAQGTMAHNPCSLLHAEALWAPSCQTYLNKTSPALEGRKQAREASQSSSQIWGSCWAAHPSPPAHPGCWA